MGRKTVLITGSSGHVGFHLSSLLSPFHNIITLSKSDKKATICTDITLLTPAQIHKIYDDFSIDTVIHCAGHTDPKKQEEVSFNVFSFSKFLVKDDIRHIVLGSVAEYGELKGTVSESTNEHPISLYGVSKLFQERVARYYFEERKDDIVYMRISNILMPYGRSGSLIESIFRASEQSNYTVAISNPHIARDYIDVRDVAHAIMRIIPAPSSSFLYNVCSGKQTTYEKLLHDFRIIWQDNCDKPFPRILLSGKTESFCEGMYTIRKGEKELGWKPVYSLRESIHWMIKQRYE